MNDNILRIGIMCRVSTEEQALRGDSLEAQETTLVEYAKTGGDLRVDGKYIFEIGGADKDFAQIADMLNSYILADDIEYPSGNKLPLWIIGFLY